MKTFRAIRRFTTFFLMTVGIHTLWMIGYPFARLSGRTRKWREFIFQHWSDAFVWILGIRIKVIGIPPSPPFFLVSNHLGYVDIPALRSQAKFVYVAKGDIEHWPVAGTIVGSYGTIFIDRNNRRDIPRAGELILAAIARGEGVAVFPEGTSSDGQDVLKFNSSFLKFAADTDLPVHYATISYRTAPGQPPASEAVAWWREESTFAGHIWGLFKIPHFDCTITFGERPVRLTDRKELAAQLRAAVAANFTHLN